MQDASHPFPGKFRQVRGRVIVSFGHGFHPWLGLALRLFDESNIEDVRATITNTTNDGRARMQIAAHHGAMTIWNFAKSLEGMTGRLFTACPTVSVHVDHNQLRSVRKLLRQSFPDFVSIRHSVAHAAELREKVEEHRIEGTLGQVIPALQGHPLGTVRTKILIRNSLQGRRFVNTFDGRLCAYEVNADTLAVLNSIKAATYAAFSRCALGTSGRARTDRVKDAK